MAEATAAQARMLRELRALSSCSRAVMRATDERTLLADVCRIVCDEAGYRMAWVGYPATGEERALEPVAWAGVEHGYLGTVDIRWDDPVRGGGPSGIAFRTGSTAVAQDFATEPALAPWREAALQRGYRSCIALPLRDGERTFGVLCIYSTEPGAFTEEERRLVEELSGDLAFGIVVLRGREGLRFAERERAAHLHHLESMDRVNRAIVSAANLEAMLSDVLDVVLSVFRCDRAFLLYPCDPDSATWQVPMERWVPEHPGMAALGLVLPTDPQVAETFRTLLAHDEPVRFGPGCPYPLPGAASERFGFRSLLSMAIRPRSGSPWQFGVHQCSGPRDWTADELLLFQEVGRRLADALSTRLAVRDLAESTERLEKAERMALLGSWDSEAPDWRTTMSAEALRIFGLPPEPRTFEHPAWHALWRTVVHEDDLERVEPLVAASLAGGPRSDVEYQVVWPGGEVRHLHVQADVVLDEAGRTRRVLGTVQDVTDRKRAEEALRSSEAQLRQAQKLEAVGRLAGGVAHDFNNVLTAILGDAQALLDGLGPSDPLRVEAAEILDAGQRAALLVRKLLAFGRRQQSEPCAVDLGEALRELERLLRRLVGEDVELTTVLAPDLGRILLDPVQFEQVVLNLVVNARDAMPRGGRLTVEARNAAGTKGPAVVLTVRDTGTGMSAEVREHLFEPFFTTKEPGKGTGLGLATVYAIVTQAGGSIRVESEPGEGSSFEVSFPRADGGPPRPLAPAPAGARGTERVLVVEDEPLVRAHAVRSLRAAGYDVVEASGSESALALVASGGPPIDLLVTDVVMPRMGGPELAARLRSTRPDLPVLFTSGYTDRAGELRSAPGADAAFLPKPFTPGELSQAVRDLLDRRRGPGPHASP